MENKLAKRNSNEPPNVTIANKEEFRFVGGRRYHNVENSKYLLPNDDEEWERLHMQHFIFKHVWQGNFASPVNHILNSKDAKILDSGCGAGSWSLEMATAYPHAKFTGIDISPIQSMQIKPDNFNFIQVNLIDGLPFADDTFDYVFQRFLCGSLTKDKWSFVISELTRVLKPGGYLELVEMDSLAENLGPTSVKLGNALYTLAEQLNFETAMATNLKSYFERQERLQDIVKEEDKLIHGGKEAGKFGQMFNDDLMMVYNVLKAPFLPILQVTSEEYDQMVKITREEWLERNSHHRFVRVYARKG